MQETQIGAVPATRTSSILTRSVVLIAIALAVAIALAWIVSRDSSLGDFRAFYCAGAVARAGGNPYLAEPLHTCELNTMSDALRARWLSTAIPAPVPPYAIAVLGWLSFMSFATAAFVWNFIVIVAAASIVVTVQKLTLLPYWAIILAIALPVFGTSATLGQIAPVAIAGVCLSAWFVSRNAWWPAAIAAGVALLDPRLGIPLCASLAIWLRPMRLPLGAVLLSLLLGAFALGAHANIEYLTSVLPAHALSELASDEQYSLSVLLYSLGMPAGGALFAGGLWYLVMAAFSIVLAKRMESRFGHSEFLALVPPACAVIGGPFVHLTQIAVAIPALLLLISLESRLRPPMLAALTALALPWPMAKSSEFVLLATALTFGMLWWLCGRTVMRPLAYSFVVLCAAFALHTAYAADNHSGRRTVVQRTVETPIRADLAEASWARLMWASYSDDDAVSWAKRAPTWGALVIIVLCFAVAAAPVRKRTVLADNTT